MENTENTHERERGLFTTLRSRNERGFTLIEVVSVIVVFAIAIPALTNLLSSTLVQSNESVVMSKAAILAQEKMEEILADKRNPARGYAWVTTPEKYSSDTPEPGYTRTVVVEGAGHVHNGVSFAYVEITMAHSQISNVTLTMWLTDY